MTEHVPDYGARMFFIGLITGWVIFYIIDLLITGYTNLSGCPDPCQMCNTIKNISSNIM
jgi:hypothetical protein